MPNTQSKEKVDLLKWLGAEVHPVPAVPFTDPMNYNHQAKRCATFLHWILNCTDDCNRAAEAINGAVWANQFDNIANRFV